MSTVYGLAFGLVLFVFAFGSMGFGHGSYLPVSLFSAPLSLIPVAGLFSAPVFWALVGWLLRGQRRRALGVVMAVHTCAAILILVMGTPGEPGAEQWRYFHATQQMMPVWLWSGLAFYASGLAVVWVLLVTTARGRATHTPGDKRDLR